jgi:hypothetical protein
MTLDIPSLLALLGTALMAVAIFAPKKLPARPAVSFAPPLGVPPVERWAPPLADDPLATAQPPGDEIVAPAQARWPALLDARSDACDVDARLALVDALARLGTAWSEAILTCAQEDEPDETVREAIRTALMTGGRTVR